MIYKSYNKFALQQVFQTESDFFFVCKKNIKMTFIPIRVLTNSKKSGGNVQQS